MQTLVIATTNAGKLKEIRPMLDGLALQIVTLADFPGVEAPDETGETFAENARAKALYYTQVTQELTVAEDSGLAIDALGGAPGVHSARYGGAAASYPEKFALIDEALRLKHALGSPARFVCAVALAREGRVIFEAEGVIEGRITAQPKGEGGFGYDPIFFYPPFNETLAEAGERKSSVSHRAHAFRALRRFLQTY